MFPVHNGGGGPNIGEDRPEDSSEDRQTFRVRVGLHLDFRVALWAPCEKPLPGELSHVCTRGQPTEGAVRA